jgi:hypothetical protein
MPAALVTGGTNGPLAAESPANPETLYGPLTLANQAAAPAVPSAGVVLYPLGGVLTYTNPQGLVNTMVGSQGGIQTAGITTVNTTAAEAVLQSMPLPANDAIPGAVYKMVGWGTYGDTGTPTLAFGSRLGGAGGTSLSTIPATILGSGVSALAWRAECLLNFLSATTAQVFMEVELGTSNSTAATTLLTSTPSAATAVSLTSAKAWVLTVTFSASSASNSISLLGGWTERVA